MKLFKILPSYFLTPFFLAFVNFICSEYLKPRFVRSYARPHSSIATWPFLSLMQM